MAASSKTRDSGLLLAGCWHRPDCHHVGPISAFIASTCSSTSWERCCRLVLVFCLFLLLSRTIPPRQSYIYSKVLENAENGSSRSGVVTCHSICMYCAWASSRPFVSGYMARRYACPLCNSSSLHSSRNAPLKLVHTVDTCRIQQKHNPKKGTFSIFGGNKARKPSARNDKPLQKYFIRLPEVELTEPHTCSAIQRNGGTWGVGDRHSSCPEPIQSRRGIG